MRVRRATDGDLEIIAAAQVAMAQETEALALDALRVRRGVLAVLSDSAKGLYYIAELGGEVAGSLLVTYEWSDWRDGNQWWIQSVYVWPAWRRRGVYRALHEAVVADARAGGAVGVRLYVATTNTDAMATYEALGMEDAAYRIFELSLLNEPVK